MQAIQTLRTLFATVLTLTCASAHAEKLYSSWTQEYDTTSTVSQGARAVCHDARGNVLATGYAIDGSGQNRFYTVKYDALDGHIVWQTFYDPNGNAPNSSTSSPMAIACDSQGNAIVTSSQNISGSIDVVTVKYAAANGAVLWTKIYDGTAGGQDEGVKVAVDGNDDVIVTAKSVGVSSQFDIVTIKYASATGNPSWANPDRYNATNRDDVPAGLVIDGGNNIIVVGDVLTASGEHSFYIRKLNSAGVLQWSKTIDTGLDGGATAVAVNGSNTVFTTGLYTNASGHHGYYTVAYNSAGTFRWARIVTPTSGDFTGKPTDIAVGPDGNPVVTGYLQDDQGTEHAYTIKHDDANTGASLGDFYDLGLVQGNGQPFGDTRAKGLIVDGSSNIVIVGESDGEGFDPDLFVTKYNSDLSARLFFDTYNGTFDSTDTAWDIAADGNGGVAIAAEPTRKTSGGTGRGEFFVRKYNRFLLSSGDDLPDTTAVPENAKYASGGAPAVADTGAVAARITMASGTTKLGAIFTQGVAGGTALPAVQKGDAPSVPGAKFASFSDPIISPNGRYAFAAKMTGVATTKASGVWTNLGGTLHLALQQGTPVPGMTENLVSVMSLSLSDSRLVALVKVAAPTTSNVALVSIDSNNNGTVLRRTGQPITANGVQSTIKSITVLSPAKASPGDGRWHRGTTVAAKLTLADKRTVIIHPNSGINELVTGGGNFNPKSFGLPALSPSSLRFATLLTQNVGGSVTTANDSLIIRYDPTGTMFEQVAVEGGHPNTASLNTLTFAGFADPLIDNLRNVLFLATLKGSGVTTANNKALLFGQTHAKVARTGDPATDSAGLTGSAKWSSFVAHTLCGSSPVFVAKLSGTGVTAKNNVGLWAVDSDNVVRRLLRTGDVLGSQTVKSFTMLKAVPTAFSAARSVNSVNTIAALVTFTNGKQALVKIGIP